MTWHTALAATRTRVGGMELLLPAAALFLLLCVAYSFSIDIRATRGASITGDEPFYLLTTQSLLADGDFDLTNQYETRSYVSFSIIPTICGVSRSHSLTVICSARTIRGCPSW